MHSPLFCTTMIDSAKDLKTVSVDWNSLQKGTGTKFSIEEKIHELEFLKYFLVLNIRHSKP